ncbi:MAG: ABC transporter ATP-binding protein [Eubacteriales bacterium]
MENLAVENLTFTYPLCTVPAVDAVSFTVNEGDFTVVCGATGSGKSTLLRLLKRELSPLGEKSGRICYKGTPIDELSPMESACSIGFVMQKPEQQIVTDKVWHELAFGLENMKVPQDVIARRVAEMASYFGIETWYEKSVSELSGGQKQLLNLAAVMVMNPEILILDEPTAQLDPIATSDFIATLKKLNNDFSLTVIIVEHRLEELIPICDRLLVMEKGRLVESGPPREVIAQWKDKPELLSAMPTAARLYHALDITGDCPLTVREGRTFLEQNFEHRIRTLPRQEYLHNTHPALEFSEVSFRYERDLPDVLQNLNLTVYENEIFCILGGNGSGKTTSLGTAAGLLKPYSGTIRVFGKKLKEYKNQSLYRECLALLPQDVQTVFLCNTVREELEDAGADLAALPYDIRHLCDKHPYDLSGGEQQLVALAKVLAAKPRLLLMDEPTKGLDAGKKLEFIRILKQLKATGVTIVIVTHDVEFTAMCADRCALFFRGRIVSVGVPDEFFSENSFYTTAASRMSKGYYDRAVTVESIAELCRQNGMKNGGTSC